MLTFVFSTHLFNKITHDGIRTGVPLMSERTAMSTALQHCKSALFTQIKSGLPTFPFQKSIGNLFSHNWTLTTHAIIYIKYTVLLSQKTRSIQLPNKCNLHLFGFIRLKPFLFHTSLNRDRHYCKTTFGRIYNTPTEKN